MPTRIEELETRKEIKNLILIYEALGNVDTEYIIRRYGDKGILGFKLDLIDIVIDYIKNIHIIRDIDNILVKGKERANLIIGNTYEHIKRKIIID